MKNDFSETLFFMSFIPFIFFMLLRRTDEPNVFPPSIDRDILHAPGWPERGDAVVADRGKDVGAAFRDGRAPRHHDRLVARGDRGRRVVAVVHTQPR